MPHHKNSVEALKTILYFSIFKYPLKLDEICKFHPDKDREQISSELDMLMDRNIIYKVEDFYLSDCDTECIEKRKKGNAMAMEIMWKARERAEFIGKFPFVEGVGVSGSLSKGYYDEKSDIDFFIITKPGRLWVARTLLVLYKKIFLGNSRKYFCVNYFITSDNLEVGEKNRFTATEICTLIPFTGQKVFENFYKKNNWVIKMFGSFTPDFSHIQEVRKPLWSRALQVCGNTIIGPFIDAAFKKLTVAFWKKKFSDMPKADFKVALKSTNDVSKHHPKNFQKKVILMLNEKYDELRLKHNIELQKEYA